MNGISHTDSIKKATDRINQSTDCSVLTAAIREHSQGLRDSIESGASEMAKLAQNYLPIVNPPGGRPSKIVKWVKKLISGTIAPQIKAHAQYAMELAELAQATAEFGSAIANSKDRLEHCVDNVWVQEIEQEIEATKDFIRSPLTNALTEVEQAQMSIESVLGAPLSSPFDFGNPDDDIFDRAADFSASAGDAMAAIDYMASAVIDDDTDPPLEGLQETVDPYSHDIVYEDGVAISKTPVTRGFTGTLDVITDATEVNTGTEEEPNWETQYTTSTLTFNNGIITGSS